MEPTGPSSDPIDLYQHALTLHGAGRLTEAAALYGQLLGRFPDNPLVMTGLGTIALQQQRLAEGVDLLTRSLGIEPDQPAALANLGLALRSLNRLSEAVTCFDRAIAMDPGFEDAYNYRGLTLQDMGRFNDGLASLDRAVALNPGSDKTHNNRGVCLLSMDRPELALACFERAIALNPRSADAYSNRGNVLRLLGRLDESLASCERAIALDPRHALAYNNMGSTLHELDRFDAAVAAYERAIALKPDHAEAYYNLGTVFHERKQMAEAVAYLNQTITHKPDYCAAWWNLAVVKLLMGNFEEGWELYEWRWKDPTKNPPRALEKPLWLGGDALPGKTLLVYAEQGYGDFIQFCRYGLLADAQGASVIFEVRAPLTTLIASMQGNFRVIEQGQPLPPFDVHCPVMSLPLAFKTTVPTTPATIPYLFADAEKLGIWRRRLGPRTTPRVGLAWSGSATHKNDRNRSIPLALLKPLLDVPVEFHALQKEIRDSDAAALHECARIHLHDGDLHDFSDTAALLHEMDLVICVDTSVAHLAGAMGKPVWILLPYMPDYRWMLDRSDSPWYPSATLFRQAERGNWTAVVAAVQEQLARQPLDKPPA